LVVARTDTNKPERENKMKYLEIANHLTRLGKELEASAEVWASNQEHLGTLCMISGQLEHLVAQVDLLAKPMWDIENKCAEFKHEAK